MLLVISEKQKKLLDVIMNIIKMNKLIMMSKLVFFLIYSKYLNFHE